VGAKVNKDLYKVIDRQKAIELAFQLSKKGDIIGIFGKGHEKTMNIKGKELPWSDTDAIKSALKKHDS
jgi:UDP-N-acetylmuramoyl-L-alanyl-D-glutamate--2,6-diaminopimelate ligase